MQKCNCHNKRKGFTIIETLVYISLTSLILMEGISLFTSMYKSYIDSKSESIEYNNIQNFYINIDNILSKGNIENVEVKDNRLFISKHITNYNKYDYQIINSYDGNVVVKYTSKDQCRKTKDTINIMLEDIQKLKIDKKENLIYLTVIDAKGREFIRCI